MNVIKDVLPHLLSKKYKCEPDGRIIDPQGRKTDVWFTDDCLFAVRCGAPDVAKRVLAVAKILQGVKWQYVLPIAANGSDLLFVDLESAKDFGKLYETFLDRDSINPLWGRGGYAGWQKDIEKHYTGKPGELDNCIASNFIREFYSQFGIEYDLDETKKALNKIDYGALVAEFCRHLEVLQKYDNDQSTPYSTKSDLLAYARNRIVEIDKGKTLYGQLESRYKWAFVNTPAIPKKDIGKIVSDFASTDYIRPQLTGIYHDPDGYAVATDTYTLIATPKVFDAKRSGEIVAPDGKKIDGIYVNWRAVVPSLDKYCKLPINIGQLCEFVLTAKRQAEVKRVQTPTKEYIAIQALHPTTNEPIRIVFESTHILRFLTAATTFGNGSLYVTRNDATAYCSILLFQTDEERPSYVLAVPCHASGYDFLAGRIFANRYLLDLDFNTVFANVFDATNQQPTSGGDKTKQLKLLKLKAKAAKAKLALMQLDGFDLGMSVHHNSPHLLKRADGSFIDPETGERLGFDHKFMSTGEGAQAHGWGTYVSEKDLPNYAETYVNLNTYRGKTINEINAEDMPRPLSEAIYNVLEALETPSRTPAGIIEERKDFCTREIAYIKEQNKAVSKIANIGDDSIDYAHNEAEKKKLCDEIWNKISDTTAGRDVASHIGMDLYYGTPYSELIAGWRDCFERQIEDYKEEYKAYERFDPNDFERHEKKRHHYIVEIPDNNGWNYIEADFDLTQAQIQKILAGWKYIADYSYMGMALELPTNDKGKLFAYDFGKVWEGATLYHWLRDRFEGENDTERAMRASKFLHRCGFVGIHYFGHWRDGSCYVIFDENDAKITSHNLFGLGEADEEAMEKCRKAIERSKRKIANWKAEWKIAKEVAAAEEQRGIKERLAAISAKADAIVGEKLTRESYNKLNPADKKKIDELNEEYTNVQQEYSKTIDRPYDLLEKINAEERKVSDQEATLNRLMKEHAAQQPAAPDNKTKLLKLKAKAAKAKLELMKISDESKEPKYKVGDRFLDKRTIVGYNPKKGWIYQITQVGFNNAKGKWIYLADLMNGRAINKIHGHGKMFYDEDLDSFAKLSDSDKMGGINDFEERHALYLKLLNDSNYYDVMFNPENGGLKAVHYGHNFDKEKGHYEKEAMEAGFSAGHCVVLENESDGDFNQRFTEGTWDGLPLEIAGRETATSNNMLSGLSHCASKPKTKVALLYLPKEFSHKVFYRTLQRYKGLKKVNNGQYREFERIICIHKGVIVVDCAL